MEKVTDTIINVGVNDYDIDLFEGQYDLDEGMAYNSYVIMDDKIAILDTVDSDVTEEWMKNLKKTLGKKEPDYLVVHHMEPDHSGSILDLVKKYPNITIVTSAKAVDLMKQFAGQEINQEIKVVAEGDTLELGSHTLNFIAAPMVHWPEVLMSYESSEKVLFSADAFGKFGTRDADEDWACEARRYYFNIVGKYGMQVQNVLKKAADLDIQIICPLHGPVLDENLGYYLDLYNTWSSYEPEDHGVFICYASIHGHTAEAAEKFVEVLQGTGEETVAIADLTDEDIHECVEDAFRYDRLVLAASSYDAGVFPPMEDFLRRLKHKNYQNRKVYLIENGSWAPSAARAMKAILDEMNVEVCEQVVTIKSKMTQETLDEMISLAQKIVFGDKGDSFSQFREERKDD
ncbi:MAG: FprA family A-type flavoprotein [Eubacterium sp.]|nr:FprA family A-type flavoprotein [Eubacterium sp.]